MDYELLALPCVVNSCLLLRVAPPLVPHGSPTVTGSILAVCYCPGAAAVRVGAGKSSEALAPDIGVLAFLLRGQFSKNEFKRLHPHRQ